MYSTVGLREWEVVTYSGILAVVALSIATIIGLVISNLLVHVPGLSRYVVPAGATPEPRPQPSIAVHPNLAAGT